MIEGLQPLLVTALEYQKATAANAAAGVHQMDIFPAQPPLSALFSATDVIKKVDQVEATLVQEMNKLKAIITGSFT